MRRKRLLRARSVEGDFKSVDSNSASDGIKYRDAVEGGFNTLIECPPADQEAYNPVKGVRNSKAWQRTHIQRGLIDTQGEHLI
jgi:hypothetical protein